jgi:hypothetical protein
MDLVGINGITLVLLVYTCQKGVYPRDHVLPLRLPLLQVLSTLFQHLGLPVVFNFCLISSQGFRLVSLQCTFCLYGPREVAYPSDLFCPLCKHFNPVLTAGSIWPDSWELGDDTEVG